MDTHIHKTSGESPKEGDISLQPVKTMEEGIISDPVGHKQELERRFSLLSLAGIGLVVGNVWPALGGSILVAIYNGGPPGVIYEFIVVSVFYWCVAASIAELASALPSTAGPYLWASITPGPKYGRVIGFFTGFWNTLAWIIGGASMALIAANTCVQMYAINNPSFSPQPWHIFLGYLIITWVACLFVCVANKLMPHLNVVGIVFVMAGAFITIVVCAVMPGRNGRPPHATNSFVWTEWTADIGYSNGFVFVAGMLNGAYAVGTPDSTSHLAEEVHRPEIMVPKAIAMQMGLGFISGFAYLLSILYAINDFDALFSSAFPIAEIYHQATGSSAGTTALLCLMLFPNLLCCLGLYVTCGRTLWALARDGAAPFPRFLGKVSTRLNMPFNATITCAVVNTILGCIYLGNTTAFSAIIGSYVLMSSSSYIASILPYLLRGRKGINPGPFRLPGLVGFIINGISCGYMIVWFVIYCFPYALPTTAQSMNYSCLIWGGFTVLVGLWWLLGAKNHYSGLSLLTPEQIEMRNE